jgi:hypothetical protein
MKRSASLHTVRSSASSAIQAAPTGERLTDAERAEFERCEATIETSLPARAEALHTILNRHLYREQYGSFEEYCKGRWGFSRVHGYRLARVHPIRSATEAALQDRAAPGETNWLQSHSLPTEESVYREIPAEILAALGGSILADVLVKEPSPRAEQVRVYVADLVKQGDSRVAGIKTKAVKQASSRPATAGARPTVMPAPNSFRVTRHFDVLIDGNVVAGSEDEVQQRISWKWLAAQLDEILTAAGMQCRVEVTDVQARNRPPRTPRRRLPPRPRAITAAL